jgi:hypothetical protein
MGTNASALFLEAAGSLEMRELQPLPDASEAGWDRWMLEVSGADFLRWRATLPQPAPPGPTANRHEIIPNAPYHDHDSQPKNTNDGTVSGLLIMVSPSHRNEYKHPSRTYG